MWKNLDPSLRRAFYGVGLAFLAMFVATYYTVKITLREFEPVIDKNYYESGLRYEKLLQERKALQEEGYEIRSSLFDSKLQELPEKLLVTVTKQGEPVKISQVDLILERKATIRESRTIPLSENSNGQYETEFQLPGKGTWIVSLMAKIGDRRLERSKTLTVF